MAFSEIEINEALQKHRAPYGEKDESFLRNLQLVRELLYGKISQLPLLEASFGNMTLMNLAVLFAKTKEWTTDDDLLVCILSDPEVSQYTKGLAPMIFMQQVDKNDQKNFDKQLLIFQKLRYSNDEILLYLINQNPLPDNGVADHPAVKYIIESLKNATIPFNQPAGIGRSFFISNWNKNLYVYLELIDSKRAEDFLLKGLQQNELYLQHQIVKELLQTDHKRYAPSIKKFISQIGTNGSRDSESKFMLTFLCYTYDGKREREDLLKTAKAYLDDFTTRIFQETYPISHSFSEENEEKQIYTMSNWALFFVIRNNKEEGWNYINRLFESKRPLNREFIELVAAHYPEESLSKLLQVLQLDTSEYDRRGYYGIVLSLLKKYPVEKYRPTLWKVENFKSKLVRELVAQQLIELDQDAVSKAISLLQHKKSEVRSTAILMLSAIGSKEAIAALKDVMDKEKNDDARDMIFYALEHTLSGTFTEETIPSVVSKASERGKLSKPVVDWLDESTFPELYLKSGRALTKEEVRFVLYRMSRVKEMRSDPEVKPLLSLIDKIRSAEFGKKILKIYGDNGYDTKYKYLMALIALTGNHEIVDKLRSAINEWLELGRKVMVEHAIGALAIEGSDKALRWVEWYSRKYRSKKSYAGIAALTALENAAAELGITMNELGDRIIPDFGFDGLFKSFTVNGEEFRAFIDGNFKLAFFNEDNKKLKAIPAAASAELKEEFKNISKEVRDIVKSQSSRLEHYLVVQRKWTAESWNSFFLQNPVMFIYATKIVWTIYKENKVQDYFMCQEDTSLTNVADEELTLPDDAWIAMAHPCLMSDQELKSWQQKFFDLSVEPIFPQLDRPVNRLKEEDRERKILFDFGEKEMENGAITTTLEKMGWGKGKTGDGGSINEFIKDDDDSAIQAIIEVEGVFAGYGSDHEPKLQRLYFFTTKGKKRENAWFNYPKNESDERLLPLKAVPPVFYSEVRSAISMIKTKTRETIRSGI